MTRPAAPDPARARLRGLGSSVPRGPGPVAVETAPLPPPPLAPPPPPPPPLRPGERLGWPPAAPGTPAARLRLSSTPEPPRWSWSASPEPDRDPQDDPDPDDGRGGGRGAWGEPTRGAAWDAAAHRGERWAQRWLPASWRGARCDPGRAGALALAVVTALAAVAAAVGVWRDRPVTEPVPALPAIAAAPFGVSGTSGLPAIDGRTAAPRGGPIVVSVTGRVARPGLVRLPEGARVGDAISAAGEAARGVDLTGLNLAQRLADGEQVVVGVRVPAGAGPPGGGVMGAAPPGGGAGGAPGGGGGGAGGGASPAGDKVDLNAATLEQLDQLPGVGPVTAQKILDWRTENGRFAAIEQLQEVSGIGEARFAQLRPRVRV